MSLEDEYRKATSGAKGGKVTDWLIQAIVEAGKDGDRRINGAIKELTYSMIDATPVGAPETWSDKYRSLRGVDEGKYHAGHLKHNWQFSANILPTQELNGFSTNGSTAKADVSNGLKGYGYTYYFANTAPYFEDIEMGWSGQAPSGVLRVGIARWPTIAAKWEIR